MAKRSLWEVIITEDANNDLLRVVYPYLTQNFSETRVYEISDRNFELKVIYYLD